MVGNDIAIACLDVGSVKRRTFGWAVLEGERLDHGGEPIAFVEKLAATIDSGVRVALGFECPLYVPRREEPGELTSCRNGEIGVNWCGGPGSSVLATGLVQVGWVLEQLARRVPSLRGTTRWSEFIDGVALLWVWEAFVTSRAGPKIGLSKYRSLKGKPHERDAAAAVIAAQRRITGNGVLQSDLLDAAVSSLVGMHLIATGLASDNKLLREPCVVVMARKP
jgi:hypothetical protein